LNISVHEAEKLSLEAIGRFVEASEEIRFESTDRSQVYGWIERLLVGQEYVAQGKAARGLVRRSGSTPNSDGSGTGSESAPLGYESLNC
jgi:hypothetical protein